MESILDSLLWIEELLPHDILIMPKHGGQAYFLDEHLVLILVEKPERNYEHKSVTYSFDLWRGAIFPIEKRKQNAFFIKYVFLENHPANKDWLYIPAESENFEEEVKLMLREISRRNILMGIPLKVRKPKLTKDQKEQIAKKKSKKKKTDKKKENAFLLGLADRKIKSF